MKEMSMVGTFVTRQDDPTLPSPATLADIDGDGRLDLVTIGPKPDPFYSFYFPAELAYRPGNGDGSFGASRAVATFSNAPYGGTVTAADVSDDGRPDLIVTYVDLGSTTRTYILVNDGTGGFTEVSQSIGTLGAVIDLNGDGLTDVLIAPTTRRASQIPPSDVALLNQGDGTYAATRFVVPPVDPGTNRISNLGGADLNGDGRTDLVVSNRGTLSVLLARGDGTFDIQTVPAATDIVTFELADVDGDGRTDIVYATNGEVRLLPGNGDGSFGFRRDFATSVSSPTLQTADLDGDGRTDVVVRDASTGAVSVLLAGADSTLGPRRLYDMDATVGLTIADVDGDRRPDIVVPPSETAPDTGAAAYTFWLNDGTGQFADPQRVEAAPFAFGSLLAGDLDGDGRVELIGRTSSGASVLQVEDDLAGTAGDDTVTVIRGAGAYDGGAGADRITGNAEADTLSGGAGADTILAGSGADRLDGGADADLILGNRGADTLRGGAGADTLYGGQGADWLYGDAGDDVLSGDLGADRHVFGTNSGADRVLGFDQAAGDRLDLQGQGYTLGTPNGGNAVLALTGGGTIELVGVAPAQVGQGFFA